jgi:GT2 family glycosyltransferase
MAEDERLIAGCGAASIVAFSMDVSIVIVTLNVRDYLRKCLQSIRDTKRAVPCEVIVVDNASNDASADMVSREFPEVVLIANDRNVGFGAANNQGIRISKGRYLLILNSDTELRDDMLGRFVAFADAHPEGGIFGCKMLYGDGALQVSVCPFPRLMSEVFQLWGVSRLFPRSRFFSSYRFGLEREEYDSVQEVDWVTGACMLVRREVIADMGAFDETFFIYREEVDLCLRARKAGWKVVHTPGPQVVHHAAKTTVQDPLFFMRMANASMLHYYRKHALPGCLMLLKLFLWFGLAARVAVSGARFWNRASIKRTVALCGIMRDYMRL